MVVSSNSSQSSSKAGVAETIVAEAAAAMVEVVEAGRMPKLIVYSRVQCMISLISQRASKSALAVLELSLAVHCKEVQQVLLQMMVMAQAAVMCINSNSMSMYQGSSLTRVYIVVEVEAEAEAEANFLVEVVWLVKRINRQNDTQDNAVTVA